MADSNNTFPSELVELAQKVLATTDKPDRAAMVTYYLANVKHPVVLMLRRRFCERYGINTHHPMSDLERTVFELLLFRSDIVKMIADDLQEVKIERLESNANFENETKKD